MAIRLRTVQMRDGPIRVALCAAETDHEPGDIYLDDGDHYAPAAKFRLDWQDNPDVWPAYPSEWAAMKTQTLRDAKEELLLWLNMQEAQHDRP